jgi:NADH-quinone oxidoreductase subunit L
MRDRRSHSKYFPYLAFFVSAMIGLVLSDNLLMMFVFWELVGVASFLLIGFWYNKDSASKAANKAFLYNRAADIAFVIGLLFIYASYGTFELIELKKLIVESPVYFNGILVTIPIGTLIWIATLGKSAQFPFYVWLPDAMEGPTPVSALLHAATMVAAGVYLLLKIIPFHSEFMQSGLIWIGAITTFITAIQALITFDAKKVLAFSTVSQLGLLMMAIGYGAYDAAFFHLATHAFFKACLFLSVGYVIHDMHHIQQHQFKLGNYHQWDTLDLSMMGGLRKQKPFLFICYFAAYASIIGLPFFSGFLSKENILQAFAHQSLSIPLVIAYVSIGLTAFYMTRQLVLIFEGEFRLSQIDLRYKQEFDALKYGSKLMLIPIAILAVCSTFLFFSINPFHATTGWWMKESFVTMEHATISYLPYVVTMFILLIAATSYKIYTKKPLFVLDWIDKITQNNYGIDWLITNKSVQVFLKGLKKLSLVEWLIDSALHLKVYIVIVIGQLIKHFDRFGIDGLIELLVFVFSKIGQSVREGLKGNMQVYLRSTWFWVVILLGILYWYSY